MRRAEKEIPEEEVPVSGSFAAHPAVEEQSGQAGAGSGEGVDEGAQNEEGGDGTAGAGAAMPSQGAWSGLDPRGNNIEKDCEVVGNAAGKDEDVPGGVEEAAMVECEEDDAQRIGHAAGAEPE